MKSLMILVCAFLAVGGMCSADDCTWYNYAGGSFGDANNWNYNKVPESWDRVFFPFMNMPYAVMLNDSYQNAAMYVDGADLTLNLNGNVYSLSGDQGDDRSVFIGHSNTETSRLTLNNGGSNGWLYSGDVSIGYYNGTSGCLTVSGSDAYWTTLFLEDWHGAWIGEGGDAKLSVIGGAKFLHGHGWSAVGAESEAIIDVNGIDSEWYVDGQFEMSVNGKTTVNVDNGGFVNIGKLTMGIERGSMAQININSGTELDSEIRIHSNQEPSLTLGQNGKATLAAYGSKLWNNGATIIGENPGSSGRLEIHDGGQFNFDGSLAIGGTFDRSGGTGRIEVIDSQLYVANSAAGQYVKVWPRGTIVLDGGDITTSYESSANPIVLEGGTLEGNGVIWAFLENNGGLVAVTDEGNRIYVGYNYKQDGEGTLKVVLRGSDSYSFLQVNNPDFGQATIDGFLEVEFVDGFVPSYEDEFAVIRATSVTGKFTNAVSKYIFADGRFDVEYRDGDIDTVVLTHYSPTPACLKYPNSDLNKDCKVDMFDFAIFVSGWLDCGVQPESECGE